MAQAWVGLDARSDPANPDPVPDPVWTSSDGSVPSEIRWANGNPVQDASKQCAVMDHSSGG